MAAGPYRPICTITHFSPYLTQICQLTGRNTWNYQVTSSTDFPTVYCCTEGIPLLLHIFNHKCIRRRGMSRPVPPAAVLLPSLSSAAQRRPFISFNSLLSLFLSPLPLSAYRPPSSLKYTHRPRLHTVQRLSDNGTQIYYICRF